MKTLKPPTLFVLAVAATLSFAQQKHALLIGINHYIKHTESDTTAWRTSVPPLDGGDNDVKTMMQILTNLYGWDPAKDDVTILESPEQQPDKERWATEANIRHGLEQLASNAHENDTVLFFYSGHGSTVTDSLSKMHLYGATGETNTIVPVDTCTVGKDITDKELAAAFDKILDKGARLTAIFDSCYSGQIARAVSSPIVVKGVPPPEYPNIDVKEPDLSDSELPANRGAIVLSACQFEQHSAQMNIDKHPQGLFTWALSKVLTSTLGDSDLRTMFTDVADLVSTEYRDQNPRIDVPLDKLSGDLFGDSVGADAQLRVRFTAKGNSATLLAGEGLGIYPGTELATPDKSVTLKVNSEPTISTAEAVVTGGDPSALGNATYLTVTSWGPGKSAPLRLFVPRSSLTAEQIEKLAATLPTNNQVYDPVADNPNEQVLCSGGKWSVIKSSNASSKPIALPGGLTAACVSDPSGGKVFINYPLAGEFSTELQFSGNVQGLQEVSSIDQPYDYILMGKVDNGHLKYAWVAPNTPAAKIHDPNGPGAIDTADAVPMPDQTNWVTIDEGDPVPTIKSLAEGLVRMRNLLTLGSHDSPAAFPVHIELKGPDQATLVKGSVLNLGSKYTLNLALDEKAKPDATQRYIYVFDVDPGYASTLLYPRKGQEDQAIPARNETLNQGLSFTAPFGRETFFLVTSPDRLPHEIFSSSSLAGLKSGGRLTALGQFLHDAYTGMRDPKEPGVPANWSISHVSFFSQDSKTSSDH